MECWKNGMMECRNAGIKRDSSRASYHHSIIPLFRASGASRRQVRGQQIHLARLQPRDKPV